MLTITVPEQELFDEATNEFVVVSAITLELEHSLVSLSKWESEFETPFMEDTPRTTEQTLGYIRAMTLAPDVPESTYYRLDNSHIEQISAYIDRKMTATWFTNHAPKRASGSGEKVTAELIYYWMIALDIPVAFETWHLKRLLTLIQVCNLKNQPAKKMPRKEAMTQQASLNAARKAQMGTTG